MSCTMKVVVLNDLKGKNILSKTREILDFSKFDDINTKYTKHAVEKYGLETNGNLLFDVSEINIKTGRDIKPRRGNKTIYRAVPNDKLFDLLDNIVVDYKDKTSNNIYEKVESESEAVEEGVVEENIKDIRELEDKNTKNILNPSISNNENTNSEEISNFNNFILFNNESKSTFTAKEVLSNIKSNFDGFNSSSSDVIDNLIPILEASKAKVKIVSQSALYSSDTFMQYDDVTNEITISKSKLEDSSEEFAVRTLLHEVVHSVTVQAYNKPNSIEQKMFKSFIDEMFTKYKELGNFKTEDALSERNYGFTRAEEFIAEIMTNVEFQDEIKALEKGNLWNKFVDFIRTLVGLKKISEYNSIINEITSIAKNFQSNDQYSTESAIFEKKDTINIKDIPYYKLRTIQEKLTKGVNDIKDTLENNIKLYDYLVKQIKDPSKLKEYSKKQKEILDEIEELDETNYWKAITIYVNQISKNIENLQSRFKEEDLTSENISRTISLYKKYLESNALVDEMQEILSDAKFEKDLPITKEELLLIQNTLSAAIGEKTTLEKDFNAYSKHVGYQMFNNRENSREILYEWKKKLRKEYKDLGISENFEGWFLRQIDTTYKEEFDKDVSDKALDMTRSVAFDISKSAFLFNADLNTNSDLVQMMGNLITSTNNKIIDRKRDLALNLQSLFDEFIKEKGNKKPSELYKNFYEKTKTGDTILKGKYSIKFKEEYESQRDKFNTELEAIKSKHGESSPEAKSYYNKSDFKKWKASNLKSVENNGKKMQVPADKWLTNESKMSDVEVKVLHKIRLMFNVANKETFGTDSLISRPVYTAVYYSLPSVTKSDLERSLEGNVKGILKDKWKNITSIREDEIGYEEEDITSSKKTVLKVRVHYRGKLEASQQSLDLFTLALAEAYNGISFQEKNKAESEASVILDIAKNKEFYKTTGNRMPVIGKFVARNKRQTIDGKDSNTYKRLESLMQTNFYDILHKNAGKWGPLDVNKIVGFMNGATATIGLAVNEVSSVANVLNGKSQMFLEGIAGNIVSFKSIGKSEALYFKDSLNNLKDTNKAVGTSFTNQVNDMFDTFGAISASVKQAFIKNTIMKSNLNMKSLQFMQETGEHWMQSVLTMSVLDTIQVLDKDGNFLNEKGNVVKTKDKAASVLDMLKKDSNGKLQLDNKVVYTTHTLGVKYNEGGREKLTQLVKKKVFDTAGNYDTNKQPEAMRHAVGKLGMMYRRFLIPMGLARFRGFVNVNKNVEDLEDHQKFFSEGLQEYETGTYTELVRYMWQGPFAALKKMQFNLITENWSQLSIYQRKQITKAISEIVITSVILPTLGLILQGLASDDDDDKGWVWFLILENRRLQSELEAYRDISEQWKILNSPIPSSRLIEGATSLGKIILSPSRWDDRLQSGNNKDKLKWVREVEKFIPILNSKNSTYKQKWQYIENMGK